MDLERWQRLSPLLDALLELEPLERERHLAELRGSDPELAAELEKLVALEHGSEDFLSEPLVALAPSARSGAMVGPYRLELLLGEGGMGQVWEAVRADGLYQRRVALKLLRPGLADPNLRLRFTRERQILVRLEHPHIARLLDAGISSDSQPYLALEYVEGQPITDYCRSRAVPLETRLALFQQVCEAVSHAHANLIVHRDLKPSNILVTAGGEVRLLDFGIAKLLDTDNKTVEHTRTGMRAFTLHYAAPEQVRGEPVTTMTDVYSLGVVLYELLTDAKPYRLRRQTDAEWEEAIVARDPQRPSQALLRNTDSTTLHDAVGLRRRARALAGDLDNITLKALAKRPEQRYPSVEALTQDLQRYQGGRPVLARAQSVGYRVRKYVHRHRWALATAVVVATVLLGALGIVAWQAREAVREAARAQAMQDFVIGLFESAGVAADGKPLDVIALLKAAEERGDRGLSRQPRARAEVLGVIARIHIGLGNYQQALSALQRQAAMIETMADAPPSLRLQAATQIGRAHRLLGEARACVDTMEPLLDDARRGQVQLASQAAEFYSQLGRCRRANGESRTARSLYERSLALRRDPLGDKVGAIENLVDLAALHIDFDRPDEALRGFNDALQQLRAIDGEKDPLAIDILLNIGAAQRELAETDAAERTYREAVALATQQLGVQHPTTLTAQRQLAGVHLDQGHLREAGREFRELQRQLSARLGDDHSDVGALWRSLGMIAWQRGNLPQAASSLREAIRIWRLPGGAQLLPEGLSDYAKVLAESGRDGEALRLLDEAHRLLVARVGPEHPLVADVDRLVGEQLTASGRDAEARLRLNQAVTLLRRSDADSAHTARAELALARLQARGDEFPAAMRQFERIAKLGGARMEFRQLRWRARAYAAEARCNHDGVAPGRGELDALIAELTTALPDGGALPREVARLRNSCR